MADDPDRFAFPKLKRHAVKNRHFAVAGMQVRNVEDEAIRLGGALGDVVAGLRNTAFANAHARFPR